MAMDGELFIKPPCVIDSRKRMADAGEHLGQTVIVSARRVFFLSRTLNQFINSKQRVLISIQIIQMCAGACQ